MELPFSLWPGGRSKCLTLSYDDGRVEERRLAEIMNRFGVRGTFHPNTGFEGRTEYLPAIDFTGKKGHDKINLSVCGWELDTAF